MVDLERTVASGQSSDAAGGPCYVIQLYTAVREELAACELAAQIAEGLSDTPEVYEWSTTVGLEGDPGSPRKVFVDVVADQSAVPRGEPA